MVTRRRTRVFRGNQRPRRERVWTAGDISNITLADDTAQAFDLYGAPGDLLVDCTVVRVRGEILWNSASSGPFLLGVGLIVVTAQAMAAGVTALPSPLDDDEADWFVYERVHVKDENYHIRVDSKAMRRCEGSNYRIALIAHQRDTAGVNSGEFSMATRALFLLH